MAYQLVENFAAGLDNRKSPLTSAGGTLTRLVNAMITPGGEIGKRRAFVKIADLPSNSFGLASTESKLVVFGRNVVPSVPSLPVDLGVTLQGLSVPNAAPGLDQSDYDVYGGQIYLSCTNPAGANDKAKNPHYFQNPTAFAETEGSGLGYFIRAFQTKIYTVYNRRMSFSKVNDPMIWTSTDVSNPNGAGYIDLSLQDAEFEKLTSLEVYYNMLAVFSSEAVQLWAVDPDPLKYQFEQLLRAAGTTAPRSPLQYGNGDVQFLDPSGIRSLKAKDSSNSASVSDIGSPVDPIIQTLLRTKGQVYMDKAISILEPSIGRFWMVFPDQILVLSYFPGPKITAWSVQTLDFTVRHVVSCQGKLYFRATDNSLYVYGGVYGTDYDNCGYNPGTGTGGVEIRFPYLDGKKPGHFKQFKAFDTTISGTWRVAVSYDFNNPEAEDTIGVFTQPTWIAGLMEAQGYASHFSLRFYNIDDKPATISNCAMHYDVADDED